MWVGSRFPPWPIFDKTTATAPNQSDDAHAAHGRSVFPAFLASYVARVLDSITVKTVSVTTQVPSLSVYSTRSSPLPSPSPVPGNHQFLLPLHHFVIMKFHPQGVTCGVGDVILWRRRWLLCGRCSLCRLRSVPWGGRTAGGLTLVPPCPKLLCTSLYRFWADAGLRFSGTNAQGTVLGCTSSFLSF